MPTDRAAAYGLVADWIKFVRRAVDGAMSVQSITLAREELEGVDDVLGVLIRTPIVADTADSDDTEEMAGALAVMVAVCKSRERFARAFTSCGKSALRARKAMGGFIPRMDDSDFYNAALELLDEMQQLADILRVRRQDAKGVVTQLHPGPEAGSLGAAYMLVSGWAEQLARDMATIMEGSNFGYATRSADRMGPILTQIAKLPFLARGNDSPPELGPLIAAYRQGGRVAKALNKCSLAASKPIRGMPEMRQDFVSNRMVVQAGVLELLSALDELAVAISKRTTAG